mmetsp:Transcript_43178/g.101500  ORF Transcript_43178/g.101500 Transcript_43178/m.101500 type:complete len:455 (+) Transcript_43178:113-1477(+)
MPSLLSVRSWSLGDVVAGVTVASTSLPQYIAYAELAGLPGHQGLKTSGPPVMSFAFFTDSPTLCVGVTSITALMAHAALGGAEYREAYGDERWADLLGTFAVLVGICSMVLGLGGATKAAAHIPDPVKTGWKYGFAATVVAAQTAGAVFNRGGATVKKLCVLPIGPNGLQISGGAAAMYRLGWVLTHPYVWDGFPVVLSAVTLAIVFKAKKPLVQLLKLPGLEVILAMLVGTGMALAYKYSGDTVGRVPASKSEPLNFDDPVRLMTSWVRRWPWDMPWNELADRLGGWPYAIASAAAFAAVDFLAILSVVPSAPAKELVGQGVGCVVSGMVGSAPIGGSLSRSMVAGMTGASSPLSGLVSGFSTLILAFPEVSAYLAPTPKAVLAAIVLAAVLPTVVMPKDMLKLKGLDVLSGWVTAIASLLTDPTIGFGVGLALHACLATIRKMLGDPKVKEA